MTAEAAVEQAELVYAGQRLGTGGKTFHLYYEVGKEGREDNAMTFAKSLTRNPSVGAIHTFKLKRDGNNTTVYTRGKDMEPVYLKASVSSLVLEWQVADRAASLEKQERAMEKRDRPQVLERHLDALRQACHALPPAQRRAFILYVAEVLR